MLGYAIKKAFTGLYAVLKKTKYAVNASIGIKSIRSSQHLMHLLHLYKHKGLCGLLARSIQVYFKTEQ